MTTRRAAAPAGRIVALALAAAVTTLVTRVDATSVSAAPALAPTASTASTASTVTTPTTVRIATFNMLGYSHTAPGGDRKGWAGGLQRTAWATQIMRNNNLQVVGLQEFQVPQFHKFVSLVGSSYDVYPGVSMGGVPVQNSLVWRKDLFTAVEEHTLKIPYFKGTLTPMPYVLLRQVSTGQELWVYNSHNPADSAGPAQGYRNRAVAKEIGLVNRLEADYPGVPVLNVGDKNDRQRYLCPIMQGTDLRSPSGGSLTGTACTMPYPMYNDWITGNSEVSFSHYRALHTALVRKTTDHHVLYADATLTPAPGTGLTQHVVIVDISALRGPSLRSRTSPMPTLRRMMRHGAATTEARTAQETVSQVPNILAMLTARPPSQTGARYVASAFDPVHDAGLRTGFWTSSVGAWRAVSHRWNAAHGAPDVTGPDNGPGKITVGARTRTDRAAMKDLETDLRDNGTALSVAVLSAADRKALRYGGTSAAHATALAAIDGYLAQLLSVVRTTPSLASSTTILVTSDHGAVAQDNLRASESTAYRVPVVAWGAGVAPEGSLYALNPQFADPGRSRVGYRAGHQPIRVAYLGNLATRLLDSPAISTGSLDPQRTFGLGVGQ